ncbi:MAG: hypothetical protein WD872_09725 [Pirellulaceae bacterium]
MSASLADSHWLASDAAQRWLAIAREEAGTGDFPSVGFLQRLRKDLTAAQAHLVVEQVELRRRAVEKFSRGERMFFTRKGLEQATDEQIARYKASRFLPAATIADLCCGIGGDLVALSVGRECRGVDADPVCALFAEYNATAYGVQAAVEVIGVEAMPLSRLDHKAWHIDPDRRVEGRRTTALATFEPPLHVLEKLLAYNPQAAIKLAPASDVPPAWQTDCEREWIGSRGECRQQVVWSGKLARHPGLRSATVVGPDDTSRTLVGSADETVPVAGRLGRYLYEPDAAVLAAKLAAVLCREHSLAALAAGVAYLTSDQLVRDAALVAFEILDSLPFDQKQLRAYCRERQIGRLEIKKRGVEIDPEKLRKAVVAEGDASATLIVTPLGATTRALIARRVA